MLAALLALLLAQGLAPEPPRVGEIAYEGADAEALALDVVEPVDAPVARGDGLDAPQDDPSVRVRGTGGEGRGHRLVAELPHGRRLTGGLETTKAVFTSRSPPASRA